MGVRPRVRSWVGWRRGLCGAGPGLRVVGQEIESAGNSGERVAGVVGVRLRGLGVGMGRARWGIGKGGG